MAAVEGRRGLSMEQIQATYLKRTARLARGDMPDAQKAVRLLLKTYGKPRNAQLVLENALRRVHFSREDFHLMIYRRLKTAGVSSDKSLAIAQKICGKIFQPYASASLNEIAGALPQAVNRFIWECSCDLMNGKTQDCARIANSLARLRRLSESALCEKVDKPLIGANTIAMSYSHDWRISVHHFRPVIGTTAETGSRSPCAMATSDTTCTYVKAARLTVRPVYEWVAHLAGWPSGGEHIPVVICIDAAEFALWVAQSVMNQLHAAESRQSSWLGYFGLGPGPLDYGLFLQGCRFLVLRLKKRVFDFVANRPETSDFEDLVVAAAFVTLRWDDVTDESAAVRSSGGQDAASQVMTATPPTSDQESDEPCSPTSYTPAAFADGDVSLTRRYSRASSADSAASSGDIRLSA